MQAVSRSEFAAAETAVEFPNGWFKKLFKFPSLSFSVGEIQSSADFVSHADEVTPRELRLLKAWKAFFPIQEASSGWRI